MLFFGALHSYIKLVNPPKQNKLILLSFYCVRLSLRLREVAHRIVTQLWITLSLVKEHVLVSTHMQTHSLIHTDRI